ncbi:MAG: hypothetical protein ACRC06_03525 [Waterburya sp.]
MRDRGLIQQKLIDWYCVKNFERRRTKTWNFSAIGTAIVQKNKMGKAHPTFYSSKLGCFSEA